MQETAEFEVVLPEGNSRLKILSTLHEGISMDKTLFEEIWNLHPEAHGKVRIAGKEIDVPRWQQAYGQSYYYTGMMHTALPLTHPYLIKLLEWVRSDSGKNYTQVLINWYQNGNHYIGSHSDDTSQLVPQSDIYSFSFGQRRDFVITSKKDPHFRKVINMTG